MTPFRLPKLTPAELTAFLARVETVNDPDACWPWRGAKKKNGYGQFNLRGKTYLAHRFMGALTWGVVKKQACHTCDVPGCTRPDHLFDGSQSDNLNDLHQKGRWRGRKAMPELMLREPMRRAVGERIKTSKLTMDMVREIRQLAAEGYSHSSLARTFKVTRTSIENVVNRKTWKHVK